MQHWCEEFPGDVCNEEAFFAMKREERRGTTITAGSMPSGSWRTQT
jgi:hypothetical protein